MRLEMPDGTFILLVPHNEGVVVGTQGTRLPNGDLPQPSGKLVTGENAELLSCLINVIEDVEQEEILGSQKEIDLQND